MQISFGELHQGDCTSPSERAARSKPLFNRRVINGFYTSWLLRQAMGNLFYHIAGLTCKYGCLY